MKKKSFIIIVSLILVLLIVGYLLRGFVLHWDCYSSGGKWHKFDDGCADFCENKESAECPQVITESCNCGPEKCWNGEKCVEQLDERCYNEGDTDGFCDAVIGYYFDKEKGKCHWKSGCSGEMPFETMEECQKICEK